MSESSSYGNWVRLSVQPPFHLEATVRVLQRRPVNPIDMWDRGRYRRVLATSVGLVLTEVVNCGTIDEPDVRFTIRSPAADVARIEVECALRKMLGIDLNPGPMHELALRERKLRAAAQRLRGMRPPRFAGLFETFANVVPFQQLSIDAGVAIVSRLVQRFGEQLEHDGHRMSAFPSAFAIAGARMGTLQACGLSRSKAENLREIARMIVSGCLDEDEIARMSTKEALRALSGLPGIGSWSAALVLLRGFGRLDVFPPGDVGAMRGLRSLLQLGSDAPLDRVEARFGDLRGYLYFFALASKLLEKGIIHPAETASEQSGQVRSVGSSDQRNGRHLASRAVCDGVQS